MAFPDMLAIPAAAGPRFQVIFLRLDQAAHEQAGAEKLLTAMERYAGEIFGTEPVRRMAEEVPVVLSDCPQDRVTIHEITRERLGH